MEQVHGLFSAAQKANAPFIIQTTPVARNYAGAEMLLAMISAASKIYPNTVFAIHLDHGNREHALQSIESGGYNSVMIDASHETFEKNISLTKEIVEKAHLNGITVEAELGVLSGIEDDINVDEKHKKYTQPSEVEAFVKQTNCDSLAIAIGTSHGAYKFSGEQGLQLGILTEIQKRLPGFPLVLHGGSAVNIDEIQRINAAGGQLGTDAKGVSNEELLKAIALGVCKINIATDARLIVSNNELLKAIELGVCKINIATDARLIWTRVHREFFELSPAQFDPIIPGKTFMNKFEKFNLEKFELLGAVGKASELK